MENEALSFAPTEINIDLIEPNPEQARKAFDEEALVLLSNSIKMHGVLNPLIVEQKGDRYVIVAGERRWRASRMAGLTKVPVIIKNYTPKDAAIASIIENIMRQDLNPIELAEGIQALIFEHSLTQDEVAEQLSMSRPAVANYLRLLTLAPKVRDMVMDGALSAGHARALLMVPDEKEQVEVAKRAVEKGLSVRDLEEMTKKIKSAMEGDGPRLKPQANFTILEKWLNTIFDGANCYVSGTMRSGRVIIPYRSQEELDHIATILQAVYKQVKDGKF